MAQDNNGSKPKYTVGPLVEDASVAGVTDQNTGESRIVAKDATGGVDEARGVATDPRERRK